MLIPLVFFGIGWGAGVFSHDISIEDILHIDKAHFHWTDGKILGPVIGTIIALIGVVL